MYAPLEYRTRKNNDQKRKENRKENKQTNNYYVAALTIRNSFYCLLTVNKENFSLNNHRDRVCMILNKLSLTA